MAPRACPTLLVVALAAAPLLPAPAAAGPAEHPYAVEPFSLLVDGERADGWIAYPTDAEPTTLLVYAHGCCGPLDAFRFRFTVGVAARDHGVGVLAMDYRGNGHWNVWTGHRDTVEATAALHARWPIERTILWGVSMGGEVAGMAAAAAPHLYDYWLTTYGVTDLFQQYAAFAGFPTVEPDAGDVANPTGSWILEETGGLPGVAPLDAWTARSPNHRLGEMRGLARAYLNHGVGDLVVPAAETLATFDGLRRLGVPASLCLALTRVDTTHGPWVPGVGVPQIPTPVGPAAHEPGAGTACTALWLDALLRGGDPDAGHDAVLWLRDDTAGTIQRVPLPATA